MGVVTSGVAWSKQVPIPAETIYFFLTQPAESPFTYVISPQAFIMKSVIKSGYNCYLNVA